MVAVLDAETTFAEPLPPHSLDAERCLLGSMMLLGGEAVQMAKVQAMVNRDGFYHADHQVIYDTLVAMHKRGGKIDALTVREELIRRGVFEEVGGFDYLRQILGAVPSAAHCLHYAGIVREKYRLRSLVKLGNELIRQAYAPSEDDIAEKLATQAASKAARIATTGRGGDVHRLGAILQEVYEEKADGRNARQETGLRDLDTLIGGFRKGGKTIIGAKPGMGKSVFLKQIGLNCARRGIPFGVVSIEESRQKIGENVFANQTRIYNNRIAFNRLKQEDWHKLAAAMSEMANLPFYVVDSARSLSQIIAAVNVLKFEHGCQVIGVDHVHIVDGEGGDSREREISRISAELKWAWKELGVCGLEAAQLNRAGGRERPTLASLRDSGSLEQDGDTVILLHREDYYRENQGEHDGILEAIVAKNKDGASGTVPLAFDGAEQRIEDRNIPDPFEEI